MTDQQESNAIRLQNQGASSPDVAISHHRQTSGSSSTDTSNLGDPNRSSSVQRGRFLVRKVPETVNGEGRTVGGQSAAVGMGVSGEQIEKSGLPPKGAVQKGRFLVQQIAPDTDKPSLARDGSGESTTTTNVPTPNGILRKNAASDHTDPTMMRHDPRTVVQEPVTRSGDLRRQTVQKGRFLVQPRQEEPAKPPTQSVQNATSIEHGVVNHIPTGTLPGNQVIRERKGRFNLLEPGSVQLSGNLAIPVNTAQSTSQPQMRPSQPSGGPDALQGATPNQQPIFQKKGRFVVSNVPVQALFANHQQVYLQQMPQQSETVAMVFAPPDGTFYTSTAKVDPSSQVTAPVDPSQYSSFGVPPPPPPSHPPPPLQSQGLDTPLSSVSTTTHKQFQPETSSGAPSPMVSAHKAEETGIKTNHMNQPPRQTGPDGKPNVKQRFGKMLYFLDQMRSEVTEADRNIKTLQTNMKCMRERNKELEAQVRELERKYQHEKAAREATEAKLKALKKRVKTNRNDQGQAVSEVSVDPAQKKEDSSTVSCASLQPTGKVSRTNSLDGIQEIGESLVSHDNAASTKSEAGSLAPVSSTAEPGAESAPPIAQRPITDSSPPRGSVSVRTGQSAPAVPTVPANTASRGVARSGSEASHPRQQKHRMNTDGSQPIGVLHTQGMHKSSENGALATSSSFDPLRSAQNRSQVGLPATATPERESVPMGTPFVVMNAHPTVGYLTTQEVDGASLMTFHSPLGQQGDGVANAMGNGQQSGHIPIQQSHVMPGMFVVPPRMEFHSVAPSQDMQQQGFSAHHHHMGSNQSTFSSQSSQASHHQQNLLNAHHDPFDELVQTRSKSGK